MSYADHLQSVVQYRRREHERAAAIRRIVRQRRALRAARSF